MLDCVTPCLSLFAFAELREALFGVGSVHLILPPGDDGVCSSLVGRVIVRRAIVYRAVGSLTSAPSGLGTRSSYGGRGVGGRGGRRLCASPAVPEQVVLGSFAFSTDGLGLTPGNPLSLIQASESADEATQLAKWLDHQWAALRTQPQWQGCADSSLVCHGRTPSPLHALHAHPAPPLP